MKIEVEISQYRRVGENQYVPALIGLIIANPTGDEGPNVEMKPEAVLFIDLTVERAHDLAQELIRHVEMIEEGEVRSL